MPPLVGTWSSQLSRVYVCCQSKCHRSGSPNPPASRRPSDRPVAQRFVGVESGSRRPGEGGSGHHPLVDLGEGPAEVGWGSNVFQNTASRPSGRSASAALRRPGHGIHPVPRLAGHHGVEAATGGIPLLEPGDLDLEPVASGHLGHPLVRIDARHPAAVRGELAGDDAGADPDIEDVRAGARLR